MFNLDFLKFVPFLGTGLSFAGEEGGGGGEEGKKGGEDTVSKAEYDKTTADLAKAKQDLEDMRLEVLSPDYLDYLNEKDKGEKGEKGKKEPEDDLSDDKLEKLSKKQILELAEERAAAKVKGELESIKKSVAEKESSATKAEVAAFARKNPEYETYRPVMYGLSLDPKNAGLTLGELMDKAKEHVKGIHAETTEAEKKRQAKLKGEKPLGDSESLEKHKDLSPEAAAEEATRLVEEKLGPIPT